MNVAPITMGTRSIPAVPITVQACKHNYTDTDRPVSEPRFFALLLSLFQPATTILWYF